MEELDEGLLEVLEPTEDGEGALAAFAAAGSALTDQQRVFLAARLAGHDDISAARMAGYKNPWRAVASLRRSLDASVFNMAAFSAAGLDPVSAAKKLVKLTEAKTVKTASFEGKITDTLEMDDNKTQLEATLAVIRLSGMEPPKRSDITVDSTVRTTVIPPEFMEMDDADLLRAMQMEQINKVTRR